MKNVDDWFEMILAMERRKVEHHRGTSPDDYLYDQAESMRQSDFPGMVYVTYQGNEYGPQTASWGPLDGDKDKMTVLIQRKQDQAWVKLWYWLKEATS